MGCNSSKVDVILPGPASPGGAPLSYEWEVDHKALVKRQLIGAGSFGEVFVGTFLGSPCAIKTMLPKLQAQPKLVKQFVEEILLMSTLRHPNVVMFLGACTKVPNLSMVLEFCDHGSLHDFLKKDAKHGIKITMSLIFRFALDVARGVYYLHRKCNVVQRDLKARNVLVDKSLNAKVADFGLSRVLGEADGGLTACGTPAWTAPEIIRNISSGERYTEKVDVYSFGIIMWELVARREPYNGRKGVQIAYAAAEGLRPEIPPHCPANYSNLMQRCWANDPTERPAFNQILEELFQMKKECDAEAATARREGNLVKSRYSLTLPYAPLVADEPGGGSPAMGGRQLSSEGPAPAAALPAAVAPAVGKGGGASRRTPPGGAAAGVGGRNTSGGGQQQTPQKPAAGGAPRASPGTRDAWGPESMRHSNVGTIHGSVGGDGAGFSRMVSAGGTTTGVGDIAPIVGSASQPQGSPLKRGGRAPAPLDVSQEVGASTSVSPPEAARRAAVSGGGAALLGAIGLGSRAPAAVKPSGGGAPGPLKGVGGERGGGIVVSDEDDGEAEAVLRTTPAPGGGSATANAPAAATGHARVSVGGDGDPVLIALAASPLSSSKPQLLQGREPLVGGAQGVRAGSVARGGAAATGTQGTQGSSSGVMLASPGGASSSTPSGSAAMPPPASGGYNYVGQPMVGEAAPAAGADAGLSGLSSPSLAEGEAGGSAGPRAMMAAA